MTASKTGIMSEMSVIFCGFCALIKNMVKVVRAL